MNRTGWISLSALLAVATAAPLAVFTPVFAQITASGAAGQMTVVRALTAPSARRELSFNSIGVIAKTNVKVNDPVKVGQELANQDDELEQRNLEALIIDADNALYVEAKQKQSANAKVTLDRVTQIYNAGGRVGGNSEVEDAQLKYDLSVIEIDIAKQDGRAKTAKVEVQKARLKQMRLFSPIDGQVEKLNLGEGEVTEQGKPALTVVRNDPLWIEVPQLTTEQVAGLKYGQTLEVRYPGENEWQKATINFIAPVADGGSGTQSIRLEMANPNNRSTGLDIEVRLPGGASTAAGR